MEKVKYIPKDKLPIGVRMIIFSFLDFRECIRMLSLSLRDRDRMLSDENLDQPRDLLLYDDKAKSAIDHNIQLIFKLASKVKIILEPNVDGYLEIEDFEKILRMNPNLFLNDTYGQYSEDSEININDLAIDGLKFQQWFIVAWYQIWMVTDKFKDRFFKFNQNSHLRSDDPTEFD